MQFGGQTPLNIAGDLEESGLTVMGTSVASIDLAEDRERCEALARQHNLKTPASGVATNLEEGLRIAGLK